jgi:acetate kinase
MKDGRSVATTMGFTALDGLMMSRRCGALDPGVVHYILQEKGMTAPAISELLYRSSGLLGVSGISDDMKILLELGSLVVALGGLDAIVFTAGIGERAPEIRHRICEQLSWLGLDIDAAANEAGRPGISAMGSRISAWVIPTNEELMIARHCWDLLNYRVAGGANT